MSISQKTLIRTVISDLLIGREGAQYRAVEKHKAFVAVDALAAKHVRYYENAESCSRS